MPPIEGIFSIRIVVADYYMQSPILGLDQCYSEFQGKQIKSVPTIRIFGANAEGQKTCMHIHGVFPYFYIPYESKDLGSVDKFIYQIALSLDKAINISLGQASSKTQHVFKVQLVKGIPFYGYHKKEHQFLKIFLYNPRFIKRAANVLQNGAILGKIFQVHEAHVPYILQFLIDYNLYGMSFLHVPKAIIKYRKNDNDVVLFDVNSQQILGNHIEKQSTSELEIDISAAFILNRFQLLTTQSQHKNPGIESIWQDEKCRRQKLLETNENIASLEIPTTEDRAYAMPTESNMFYLNGLKAKLEKPLNDEIINHSLSSTIMENSSSVENTIIEKKIIHNKRKFNLNKILTNSVYPEECIENDKIMDASIIHDHLSSLKGNILDLNNKQNDMTIEKDLFKNSIVNEEIVLTLKQSEQTKMNLSLRDYEVLEIMRQLEEGTDNEEDNPLDLNTTLKDEKKQITTQEVLEMMKQLEEDIDDGKEIDMDSTLAPLSQAGNVNPLKISESSNFCEEEDDEGNINDFTMSMDDINVILGELKDVGSEDTQKIPQLDGDSNELTPKKNFKHCTKLQNSSPKTPKRPLDLRKRYTPLDIMIKSPKSKNNGTILHEKRKTSIDSSCEEILVSSSEETKSSTLHQIRSNRIIKRKSVQNSKIISGNSEHKSNEEIVYISSSDDCSLEEITKKNFEVNRNKIPKKNRKNLDQTIITCNLRTPKSNEKILKSYNINKNHIQNYSPSIKKSPIKPCLVKLKKTKLCQSPLVINYSKPFSDSELNKSDTSPVTKKMKSIYKNTDIVENRSCEKNKFDLLKIDGENLKSVNPNEAIITNSQRNIKNNLEKNKNSTISESEVLPKNTANKEKMQSIYTQFLIKKCKVKVKRCSFKYISPRKEQIKKRCPLDVAKEYDRRNNFFPEPGPSGVNYYELIKLPVYTPSKPKVRSIESRDNASKSESSLLFNATKADKLYSSNTNVISKTIPLTPNMSINENMMESFYVNSPSLFSDLDLPNSSIRLYSSICSQNQNNQDISSSKIQSLNDVGKRCDLCIITPKELPPNYNDVLQNLIKFGIPEYTYTQPFYGNRSDVTNNRKEIGYTVLTIPGNSLNDCQEFRSLIPNLNGINRRRKIMLENLTGSNEHHNIKTYDEIKEYFCVEKKLIISTRYLPPTKHDSKIWLKARKLMKRKKFTDVTIKHNTDDINIEDDSPIKIRRQKIVMMLNNNSEDEHSSDDSLKSISLSPMTPNVHKQSNEPIINQNSIKSQNTTPRIENGIRKSKAKLSLNKKFNSIKENEKSDKINCIPTEKLTENVEEKLPESLKSSQSNDSISSEVLIAEFNKSSFKKNLDSFSADHDKSFGLSGATLDNTFGFKVNLECLQNAKADIEYNYLTIMSLEVFVPTRNDLKPNPEFDQIECLFYSIVNNVPENHKLRAKHCGYIILQCTNFNPKLTGIEGNIICVESELEMFDQLVQLCRDWDPDIFAGYEIEMNSWGFIIDRAKILGLQFVQTLSRIPLQKIRENAKEDDKEQYTDLDFELKLCGRILLDVWRLMRSEIALTSYTYENVMYHIMHRRCPAHSFRNLTEWYSKPQSKWIVLDYYMERVNGTLELLDQLDLIGRTSEIAKLIGIQFYEVLSRGSQYRVESMMLRIAKPKNIVPLSPSVDQRAHMRAPEYLPLILEPKSRFYTDPLIVLDFQSLYPSIIIAYNYCFSTCLGRVEHLGESTVPFEFGASQLRVSPSALKKLIEQDKITISPCGVAFVKSDVREGILKRMLSEILNTRLMVKQSMKIHKKNSVLQRVLHSRQLGLKLMANVTYGYTAANYSGRMPCVEVGDSVVAKGRETLERAIKMVETNEKWRAKVVYGDTDSLFVLCPGRNRADAFKIGEEIALAVTEDNPQPVKLKLEKVYQPCILQTKKRYVGYMYESADQKDPIYEAKGIETVRRDGCPAVAKILEKTLKILFETKDVSKIKEYVCRQFTKILQGKANIQDLIYAKEFRGLNGYKPTACVPALEMTRKWIQSDPRNIPRKGERVPYVITNGPPGVPLIRLIRSPHEFLSNDGLKINGIYYITKAIIPPLNRCLLLIGADVNDWFLELPRKTISLAALSTGAELINKNKNSKKSTISQYFSTTNCVIDCGRQTKTGICTNCLTNSTKCVVTLANKISKLERSFQLVRKICQSCCGRLENINCCSLDCPVLYILENKTRDLKSIGHYNNLLEKYF